MPDIRHPSTVTFPVGLEEGPDGATLVHSLSVPGCVASGATKEEALARFPDVLAHWLNTLAGFGEPLPPPDAELEITVDEWVAGEEGVASGESSVCFEADLVPLSREEALSGLRRLGDLRGLLLARVRRMKDEELDQAWSGEWTARRALDELARAQWWTLTRLGASPMAEVPPRTVARLDTAMALVVQQFTELPAEALSNVLELDGEVWTPRKVLRRLLWLEWTLGRVALAALTPTASEG